MADSLSTSITFETHDDVAVIRMDDGKANAFGHDAIDGVNAGLERAEAEAKAVVLVGREGKFSAGFDLSIMAGDDRDARVALLGDGARLCHRLYMHPQPVVAAVTGHALALGALVLASCDLRIGADILCRLAHDDAYADASGKYWDNDAGRFASPNPAAADPNHVARVMEALDALT